MTVLSWPNLLLVLGETVAWLLVVYRFRGQLLGDNPTAGLLTWTIIWTLITTQWLRTLGAFLPSDIVTLVLDMGSAILRFFVLAAGATLVWLGPDGIDKAREKADAARKARKK